MRVLALHGDVIVFVSSVWQTTATAVRSGEEGFLIDSPVFPEELEALPSVLERAGFPLSGLIATHGDWDHLLGHSSFPEAAFAVAQSTAARLARAADEQREELREFDEEHYVVRPAGAWHLPEFQTLPVPGKLAIGADGELELHPASGHTIDGMALVIPWAGVLVAGDYLSPVEIPMVGPAPGAIDEYAVTLERLAGAVARVETVVPGHGTPIGRDEALRVLEEDRAYLERLGRDGAGAALPAGRDTAEQRRLHADNVRMLGAT